MSVSGEGNGSPLQYSCLENPMDGGAWWAAVHGVARSRTRLNDFTFTFHFHALEKEMATHSSVLAWMIPGTGEPGGLPSMGSHRVGHDWSNLAAAAAVHSRRYDCYYLEQSYSLQVWRLPEKRGRTKKKKKECQSAKIKASPIAGLRCSEDNFKGLPWWSRS